jgi:hypothetical protein
MWKSYLYLISAAHRQRREGTLTVTGKTFSRLHQQASMEYILGRGSGNFPDSKASPTGVHGGHPPVEAQDIFYTPPTVSMEYCTSSVEAQDFCRLHQQASLEYILIGGSGTSPDFTNMASIEYSTSSVEAPMLHQQASLEDTPVEAPDIFHTPPTDVHVVHP